jgi:hypothetical protein
VGHGFVDEVLGFQVVVPPPAIGVDLGAVLDVGQNLVLQGLAFDVGHHLRSDFAGVAVQHAHDGNLVDGVHAFLEFERKRVVFPSGIGAGLSLTMLSWLGLRERGAVFAEVGRWQRSEG